MEHFYLNIQGWFNYQDLYTKVIKELPSKAHIVEVGAWKGCSTAYLAVEVINSGKDITLDVVDTFKGSADEPGHMTDPDLIACNGDLFKLFLRNMEPVKHVINPIQLLSAEASSQYEDGSLDFVFIDANHTYEGVKEDLKLWKSKVKSGGIFAGHDYNKVSWPGVVRAVHEEIGIGKFDIIGECWITKIN